MCAPKPWKFQVPTKAASWADKRSVVVVVGAAVDVGVDVEVLVASVGAALCLAVVERPHATPISRTRTEPIRRKPLATPPE
jgi:hypothetical protein